MAVGISLGIFYYEIGADAGTLINNIGFIGVSVTYMAYTSMFPAVLRLPAEILYIRKESFNNYYPLATYYAMCVAINVPQQIIFAFAYISITYVMTGQPLDPGRFLMYFYGGVMTNVISDAMGQIIGTVLKASNGTFIAGVITAYLILLSGFLIVIRQSPVASILSCTSYHRYALNVFVAATLGNDRDDLPCASDYCHYNVDSVLEEYSLNTHPFLFDVLYLVATYVLACFVGYYALKVIIKNTVKS